MTTAIPASLRERKKQQTRLELIRAAVGEFRTRGYEETTVDDICEAANYSRSTFFRYFGTKEDVVFGDIPDRVVALRQTLHAEDSGDAWTAARHALTGMIADMLILAKDFEPKTVGLWFTEPALRRRYAEIIMVVEEAIAEFFATSWDVDVDVAVDCQVIASSLVGLSRAAIRAQVFGGVSITDSLKSGFDLLERGMPGPRAAAKASRTKKRA